MFVVEFGHEPEGEIDEESGHPKDLIEYARRKQLNMDVGGVHTALHPPVAVSADAPFDEQGGTYADVLQAPEERPETVDHREFLMVLAVLSARVRKALLFRTGYLTGHSEKLDWVAKEFSLTRERLRQMEEDGVRVLKDRYGISLQERLSE
jgi:DNA-directed RNA polymerase sigma subunit (sigma70/sigma32)